MTLTYPIESNAAHPARLSPAYRSTVKRSPSKPLIPMRHTLSELTGPVYGMPYETWKSKFQGTASPEQLEAMKKSHSGH